MATTRGETLLSSEFGLYPNKKYQYKVSLTNSGIIYSQISHNENSSEVNVIHFSDVIGCRCQKSAECSSAFLTIFSYPFKKKVFSSKSARKRVPVIFEFKDYATFDENLKLVEKWRNVINSLARNIPVNVEELDSCSPPRPGRLLILVNPHSGPGKALQIFNNDVKPMLDEAEIPYKLQVTEYAGHARDLIQTLNLSLWYGVVIVSGDGLIYEVINGVMERKDWEQAIHIPIGCIPGGSGNALCCSINYSAGEPVHLNPALHSTFILVKHKVVPMDLVLVQTPFKRIFSFLSVSWGLMADIDYESEQYRSIGEARFTLQAIKRIISLRSYKGRLSFLPVAEYTPQVKNGRTKVPILTKIRRFSLGSRTNSRNTLSSDSNEKLSSSVSSSQDAIGGTIGGRGDIPPSASNISLPRSVSSRDSVNGEISDSPGMHEFRGGDANSQNMDSSTNNAAGFDKHLENGHVENGQGESCHVGRTPDLKWRKSTITASGSQGDFEIQTETASGKMSINPDLSSPILPPLDEPVPDDWVVIEDTFINVCAVYQTHLGSDMLAAPHAHLSDGFLYLLLIRDGISRNTLINLLAAFGEGSHIDSPHVEMIKVLAFRLEPATTAGNIMVDGERIDVTPIQGQILPKLGNIMAIK